MNRGLARLNAERLGLRMQTVDCLGGPALRCRHVAAEPAAGTSRSAPSIARRMAGLIFADFTSFRRLRDPIFPRYYRDIMQTRSEEHTSELQSLMRISYAVFCLKKKKHNRNNNTSST